MSEAFWSEFYRMIRLVAGAAAGFFAGAATREPLIHPAWDGLIAAVLTAIAYGTSRQSDGKTIFPKPTGAVPKAFLIGLILTLGVMIPACSMGGCASSQYDARITPQGLALVAGDVQEDVNFGIQAADPAEQDALRAEADAFFAAIATKDAAAISGQAAPRWPVMKALALTGVDFQVETEQIGPGVADIHRESVFRFEGLLNRVR